MHKVATFYKTSRLNQIRDQLCQG